jgi:hypothetical protein
VKTVTNVKRLSYKAEHLFANLSIDSFSINALTQENTVILHCLGAVIMVIKKGKSVLPSARSTEKSPLSNFRLELRVIKRASQK